MPPLKLTIVRHGESMDNLRSVWAGSSDAPLSNHGMNQAKALGLFLREVPINAIYASPLLRARWTSEQIHNETQTSPKPPLTFSALLQEQHFGIAEGKSWSAAGGAEAWVRESGRGWSFPEGETLNDVGHRADEVIDRFLLPHLIEASTSEKQIHVVVVAHGIFNSELLGALLRRRRQGEGSGWRTTGMTNTGWTQALVSLDTSTSSPSSSSVAARPSPDSAAPPAAPSASESSIPSDPAPTLPTEHADHRFFSVRIPLVNQVEHLASVQRQKGGIGSSGHDPKQTDLRTFFAGGGNL